MPYNKQFEGSTRTESGRVKTLHQNAVFLCDAVRRLNKWRYSGQMSLSYVCLYLAEVTRTTFVPCSGWRLNLSDIELEKRFVINLISFGVLTVCDFSWFLNSELFYAESGRDLVGAVSNEGNIEIELLYLCAVSCVLLLLAWPSFRYGSGKGKLPTSCFKLSVLKEPMKTAQPDFLGKFNSET